MGTFDFFVVFKNSANETCYRYLVTDNQMYDELSSLFPEMRTKFFANREAIDYTVGYKLDKGEYFLRRNFQFPDLETILGGIAETEPFYPSSEMQDKIRAFIAVDKESKAIMFQSYHSLKFLTNKKTYWWSFHDSKTFQPFNAFAFGVASRLCAVFQNGNLAFESIDAIKTFLDVKDFFAEASNEQIKEMIDAVDWLGCESFDEMIIGLDSEDRKLFSQIQSLDIAEMMENFEKIKSEATSLEIPLSIVGEQIIIPCHDKKARKRTLNFLAENYYVGSFSGEKYRSNSKKRVVNNQ
ncbi:MAG: hypothetical protein IKU86_11230 [Thermoguttaceae bacterium]|nr:hypothetical protein [Thermoguttaceae bacterium]